MEDESNPIQPAILTGRSQISRTIREQWRTTLSEQSSDDSNK